MLFCAVPSWRKKTAGATFELQAHVARAGHAPRALERVHRIMNPATVGGRSPHAVDKGNAFYFVNLASAATGLGLRNFGS